MRFGEALAEMERADGDGPEGMSSRVGNLARRQGRKQSLSSWSSLLSCIDVADRRKLVLPFIVCWVCRSRCWVPGAQSRRLSNELMEGGTGDADWPGGEETPF